MMIKFGAPVAAAGLLAIAPAQSQDHYAGSTSTAEVIAFGDWPLEKADPDAVEAIWRHEIAWAKERFGEQIGFLCLGYSYGQPTEEYFARFDDIDVPLKGKLSCSPYVGEEGFSVLLGVSHIRCDGARCTARSDVSFGETIEPGVDVETLLVDGVWQVSVERDRE